MRRATAVLIVEDDAAIRRLIITALQEEGYRLEGVGDTAAALRAIRRRRPDLIITDYHLPGQDGLELLRTLRTEGFGDIPALVISADFKPPDLPAGSFLPKPFDLDAVLRAVRRALGREPNDQVQQLGSPSFASWLFGPQPLLRAGL